MATLIRILGMLVLAGMGLVALTGPAGAVTIEFNSTGGTTATNGLHFYIEDTTKIQVRRLNNTGQVYAPGSVPPAANLDNGIFIRGNGLVYGPSHTVTTFNPTGGMYNTSAITATSPANPSSSGVQQTATGTFGITSGPQVSVLWKYTTPLDFLTAEVTLTIPATYAVSLANPVRYYHVFDTYLGGSDNGCGFSYVDATSGDRFVGTYQPTSGTCTTTTGIPAGINVVESFRERTGPPFTAYCASGWASFFTNGSTNCSVLQAANMSNALQATFADTGMGIQYSFIAPGVYTFSYDFVIGSPNVPPYDHLEIRHDGSGTLCPETVTVLACTSSTVPCPALDIVNTGTLTGSVTTTPAVPAVTKTPAIFTLGSSASTQGVALQTAAAGAVVLGTSGLSTTPLNGTKCWNTATSTQSCTMTFLSTPCVSGYECMETGVTYNNLVATPTARNPLYTKLSGTNFTFDVVALQASGAVANTYTAASNVTVELFDDSASPAPACSAYASPVASQAITFGVADNGRKTLATNINLPNAYSKLRCRVRDTNLTPTLYGCSSDTFSVRPSAATLVTTATATAPSAAATPVIKAGANFNLRATTSSGTNYAGSLVRDATKLTAQITTQDATQATGGVVGTLSPATLTGNAGMVNATYTEVGHLYLAPGAYRDDSFTATDQPGGCAATNTCDCVTNTTSDANLSDALSGGKYGCSIGNKTPVSMGRFIPDHFAVVNAVLTQGCPAGAYTYMAQPFSLTASIEAQNVGNAKAQNYSGVFARGVVGTQAENNNDGIPLASRLTFTAPWSAGAAAYSATLFSRPATTTWDTTWGPYDALAIGATVTSTVASVTSNNDLDGVRLINRNMDQANTSCTADAAGTSSGTCPAVTLASGAKMRYGRARLQNAYGSELLDLPVAFRTEYSVPSNGWAINTLDSCTTVTLTFAPVGTPNITGNTCVLEPGNNSGQGCAAPLTATQTNRRFLEGGVSGTDSAGVAGFAGNFNLWLRAPGATHAGSIDVIASTLDSWLLYNWTGTVGSPRARATFGLFKSPLIYRRENY